MIHPTKRSVYFACLVTIWEKTRDAIRMELSLHQTNQMITTLLTQWIQLILIIKITLIALGSGVYLTAFS